MKAKTNIEDLFKTSKENNTYLKVCAPMVRYSKVQFRTLVKSYGVDLCFTPMILADSFCQNSKARVSEFSTTIKDSPLIVQFAANNVNDFVDATQLLYPYADGVDLNCGCPQRWAMKDGYGSALLSKPELICELVKGIKSNLPNSFSVSVKIRILKDLKKTIDMCRQMEKCGVTFLTVHGRTPTQKSGEEINADALAEVCKSVEVPIIANGGVKTLEDADRIYERVNCAGVMAASGLLTNPALFSGINTTPLDCVRQWMALRDRHPDRISFQVYHHHLVFMLEKIMAKQQKPIFNLLKTIDSIDEFLYDNILDKRDSGNIDLSCDEFVECVFDDAIVSRHVGKCRGCSKSLYYCICSDKYDASNTDGSFFTSHVKKTACDLDYMDSVGNMFGEY
ncbi:uncharacterized tRNA-dihydrouridine synthase-like protein C45G9.2 [Plutella xylostella]|uniref:uncharacterized tRNA-dihydrouridine synthase-like protein C45G9.2 n=1 Tax=Plutella xylostella TaxID=51655 RepID=UPI002032C6AF|nr:uncharacterized tRNA-dihydrouridine synthase-like protein C45G9.2 [Plutella xylostella]